MCVCVWSGWTIDSKCAWLGVLVGRGQDDDHGGDGYEAEADGTEAELLCGVGKQEGGDGQDGWLVGAWGGGCGGVGRGGSCFGWGEGEERR